MEIKQVLYKDIDDALETQTESEETTIIKVSEEDAIVAYAPVWKVTDKGVFFVEGVWCVYNETLDTLEPDWSVTLVYEDTENFDIDKFDYFEQGTPTVAIHNYLTMKNQNNWCGGRVDTKEKEQKLKKPTVRKKKTWGDEGFTAKV